MASWSDVLGKILALASTGQGTRVGERVRGQACVCAPYLAFPPSTGLLQKAGSQRGLRLSMGLSPLDWCSGAPHWLGCCCQENTYSSALCSTNPNPCSRLSPAQTTGTLQLRCGTGLCCSCAFLSPSLLGLWPPPPPCQGRGLKFSMSAHLHHARTMPGPCPDHAQCLGESHRPGSP